MAPRRSSFHQLVGTPANNSPYGLGGSIYTTDIDRGKKLASRIDTGMVFIN